MFKFAEKNSFSCSIFVVLVLGVLLAVSSVRAQEIINTAPDETFDIQLNRESSFLSWSLTDFDPTLVSRFEVERGDITGPDRFAFRAIEPGTTELEFTLEQNTVFGSEIMDTRVFQVNIGLDNQTSPDGSQPTIGGDSPEVSEDVIRRLREGEQNQPPAENGSNQATSDREPGNRGPQPSEEWNRVLELMELGEYAEARNVIDQQQQQLEGEEQFRWANKRAESFRQQGEFDQAIEAWNGIIEEFPDGPVPRWRMALAETHREAGQDDQAELELLKIRHRHRGHPVWTDAMVMLGEIASDRGDFDRARKLLEGARRALEGGDHPRLLLQLARLYDRHDPIRDYERAVNLYDQASESLDDAELVKEAEQRAEYLRENYVQFGFD